ncbi:MAG: hypothetical protein OXT09_33475, partial [Myxococcales bacterium]|nr:hypothetical protein [Myxococcales bacterium]
LLDTVNADLEVFDNDAMTSLAGFNALQTVIGSVTISDHAALASVTGFEVLSSIGSHLQIERNHALTHFNGIDSLLTIGNDLRVERNPLLDDISAISGSLTTVSGLYAVRANPSLSRCDVDTLRTGLSIIVANDQSCCNSGCSDCGVGVCNADDGSFLGQSGVYDGTMIVDVAGDLAALTRATEITGDLDFSGTDLLNVDGLEGLTTIGGRLYFWNNDQMSQIDALSSLTSVGGDLYLQSNDAITSMSGLSAVQTVGGYVRVYSNSLLGDVDLAALATVGDYFYVYNCNNVANLDSLSNLATVDNYLYIYSNTGLTNIDGLIGGALVQVGSTNAGTLWVRSNTSLTSCAADALAASLAGSGWTGSSILTGNNDCTGTCNGAVCE